jgi:hypothetical protein
MWALMRARVWVLRRAPLGLSPRCEKSPQPIRCTLFGVPAPAGYAGVRVVGLAREGEESTVRGAAMRGSRRARAALHTRTHNPKPKAVCPEIGALRWSGIVAK